MTSTGVVYAEVDKIRPQWRSGAEGKGERESKVLGFSICHLLGMSCCRHERMYLQPLHAIETMPTAHGQSMPGRAPDGKPRRAQTSGLGLGFRVLWPFGFHTMERIKSPLALSSCRAKKRDRSLNNGWAGWADQGSPCWHKPPDLPKPLT